MNSVYLLLIALCFFALAYRYYSAFITTRALMLDDTRITPAHTCRDGREYMPVNKIVLFGQHFAAIAGAGPLIGPVLAAQYGWGPGFLWILLGSVIAGGVQDLIVLYASVRHRGRSLSYIAHKEIGPVAGTVTLFATFIIILLANAGLAISVFNGLFNNPWGVFTVFMTIPISVLAGILMFKVIPGALKWISMLGFVAILASVVGGKFVADSAFASWFTFSQEQMCIILPGYSFFVALLPMWLLFLPRGYLSSYLKIVTIALLAGGVLILRPVIDIPFTTSFVNGGGPIIPGPVWPYVFITIACGAISGFHSLISSGTTSKMLERESEARLVSYGAMLAEGFVAVVALIAATSIAAGDYFAINTPLAAYAKIADQYPVVAIDKLSQMVGINVMHRPGGAVSLAVGMSSIFSSVPGLKAFMNYWYQFAIMFEAVFILTTIDSGTRVARYILQEIIGKYAWKKMGDTGWAPGILLCSAVIAVAWGTLLYSGNISQIWPMFGVANQLLALIALAISSVIVLKVAQKKWMTVISIVPAIFMFAVTMYAGVLNIRTFSAAKTVIGYVNAALSVVLIIMGLIVVVDSIIKFRQIMQQPAMQGLNCEDACALDEAYEGFQD